METSSTQNRVGPALLRPIRSFPMTTFFVIACLVGWLPYLLASAGVGAAPENLPLGPLAAAVVVTAVLGRPYLREWGLRVRSCRIPWRWLAFVALTPIAMHGLQVVINHGFGAPWPTSTQWADWPAVPLLFLAFLILVGLGEEAGWTAFAAPVLLRRHSFAVTWALLAAMRIGWHLPLMLTGNLPWLLGTLGNAGFQLVLLAVYRLSGDRWATAAVWHAMLNAFGGPFLFQMVSGSARDRLGEIMAIAYVILGLVLAGVLVRTGRHSATHGSGDRHELTSAR